MIQELDKVMKVGRKYVINQKATRLLLNFLFTRSVLTLLEIIIIIMEFA